MIKSLIAVIKCPGPSNQEKKRDSMCSCLYLGDGITYNEDLTSSERSYTFSAVLPEEEIAV